MNVKSFRLSLWLASTFVAIFMCLQNALVIWGNVPCYLCSVNNLKSFATLPNDRAGTGSKIFFFKLELLILFWKFERGPCGIIYVHFKAGSWFAKKYFCDDKFMQSRAWKLIFLQHLLASHGFPKILKMFSIKRFSWFFPWIR